jgi:hypothetical protein
VGELVPAEGGTWGGLLFDNPKLGLTPELTWSFRFPFQEVTRDYGSSLVSLDIEWLAIPGAGWHSMAGRVVRGATEPAEASIYFFQHHRYDIIDLEIVEQRDLSIHVLATLSGDVDGLGLNPVTTDAWLRFTGIVVSLSDATSAELALARLADFTDTEGLSYSPTPNGISLEFTPTGSSSPG